MTLINRYLIRQILFFFMLTTLILIGMDTLLSLVNELKWLGQSHYTGRLVCVYLFAMLPRKIYLFLPWICFFSFYACFNQLARQQELIILQTAGQSPHKILWQLIWKFGLACVIVGMILSEWVAPQLESWAQTQKHQALGGPSIGSQQSSVWLRWKEQFIWIEQIETRQQPVLKQVKILKFSAQPVSLKKMMTIDRADYQPTAGSNAWLLSGLKIQTFEDEGQQIEQIPQQLVLNFLDPKLLQSAQKTKHLDLLSIRSLWQVIQARVQNGLSGAAYWGILIQKLAYPILMGLMIWVGMGLCWGNPRHMNFSMRTIGAISFAFSVYFMQAFLPLFLRALGIL